MINASWQFRHAHIGILSKAGISCKNSKAEYSRGCGEEAWMEVIFACFNRASVKL